MTQKSDEKKGGVRRLAVIAALAGSLIVIRPEQVKATTLEDVPGTVPQRVKAVREALANKWEVVRRQSPAADEQGLSYTESAITTLWGNWGNWGNWNNWRDWNNWNNWTKWTKWGDFSNW